MNKNPSYQRRENSRDWVITWQLDGERKVNFHFRSENECNPYEDRVPEDVANAAIRYKPQANHCWEKYILVGLDPEEDWDEVKVAETCHGLDDDEKSNLLRNHVLIREWNGENGYEDTVVLAVVVDPLGQTWEVGDDFIEGWNEFSDIYPGEQWPLGPLTIEGDLGNAEKGAAPNDGKRRQ